MPARPMDLTGKTYGRLTVIELAPESKHPHRWRCRCSCGKKIDIRGDCLRYGFTKSCGCLRSEKSRAPHPWKRTHSDIDSPEYRAWAQMKYRCLNPNCPAYKHYSGRGITVCGRWMSYENFIADMGRRPSPEYSLGRKNNDKGYYKRNCRWETQEQQQNNRRSFDHGAHLRGKKHSFERRIKQSEIIKDVWRRRRSGQLPYPDHRKT